MKLLASILVASAFGQNSNARRRGNKEDSGASAAAAASDYGSFGDYGGDYGTFGGDYGGTTDFGAYGDYADSFGTADYSYGTATDDFGSYDSYGTDDSFAAYSDYTSDTAAFEEVAAEVAVEAAAPAAAPAAPAAPARPAVAAPHGSGPAVSTIREFQADDVNRPGGGFTQTNPECLTGLAFADGAGDFSAAELAKLTSQSCEGGATGVTHEDTRDYCLIEVRTVNGLYRQISGRCVSYSDCQMALTNNFQYPNGNPTHHDSCKPDMTSGRFTNKESVCRTCSHMTDSGGANFALTVNTNTVTLADNAGAALTDGANTDMKLWTRDFWLQNGGAAYDGTVHFALQQAGKK